MTPRELFEAWTPPTSIWHPWAKPVLFGSMRDLPGPPVEPALVDPGVPWAPPPGDAAIVLDVPGRDSVLTAAALARHGYQPVPLFNTSDGPQPVLSLSSIMNALRAAAPRILESRLAPGAPPAFMLDSERYCHLPNYEQFDNRWMTFVEDFPSATLLRSRGIGRIVVLHATTHVFCEDLARVLSQWRRNGLAIEGASSGVAGLHSLDWPRIWPFRWAATLAMVSLGLRRNSAGGFGSVVPRPSDDVGWG
jgi:hypothetical protein